MELSPNYAGTLMGITNMIGNVCGFLCPLLVGYITHDNVSRFLEYRYNLRYETWTVNNEFNFISANTWSLGYSLLYRCCNIHRIQHSIHNLRKIDSAALECSLGESTKWLIRAWYFSFITMIWCLLKFYSYNYDGLELKKQFVCHRFILPVKKYKFVNVKKAQF